MFDRFTRDEVSQWVWWPTAMVLVVLVVLTFPGQNRAIDARRNEAAARAWSIATGTIGPALEGVDAEPIDGQASARLGQLVAGDAIEPPWTETLRIWAADSTLLWSSDAAEPVGSAGGLNDEEITRALADLTRADQVVRDRDLDGRPSEVTFSAYAPFTFGGEIAAAEFEVAEATLLGDVKTDWLGYRIVLAVAAALVLALAFGSMREPIARIGAGVPFSRAVLPPGTEVIEIDRKLELERAGALAHDRVANMEVRLQESERQRLRAEGDLQRALSQLATRSDRPTRSVIPRPASTEPAPASAGSPPHIALVADVVDVPDVPAPPAAASPPPAVASPVAASTTPPSTVAPPPPSTPTTEAPSVPSEPAARAPRARRKERPQSGRRRSAATTWEPTSTHRSETTRRDDLVVVPEATAREPAAEPALDDGPPAEAVDGGTDRAAADAAAPSPPAAVVVPPSEVVASDDAEAREVLERLVEPVATSVAPASDPGALRAALARTAARKKPGSRHDERLADETPDR